MHLSVVIPTLDEASRIAGAVHEALQIGDEVVVADGASSDGTATLARQAGARTVEAPRGRGMQLNAGARAAGGDVLLFLHADARLPPHARGAIERALLDPTVQAGNFRLVFEPHEGAARLLTWANDVQRRCLALYYGDSGIFIRRKAFEALGGFPEVALMEDHELVRRLERRYRTAYLRHVEIRASARRFRDAPLRTLALWTAIHALHKLGTGPETLARLYRRA